MVLETHSIGYLIVLDGVGPYSSVLMVGAHKLWYLVVGTHTLLYLMVGTHTLVECT